METVTVSIKAADGSLLTKEVPISDVESATKTLVAEAKKLDAKDIEIARLKAEVSRLRDENYQSYDWKRKYSETFELLRTSLAKIDQLTYDINHWKKVIRYQQALNKPQRKVRHIPTANSLQRAKSKWLSPTRANYERIYLEEWRKVNGATHWAPKTLEVIMNDARDDNACPITQRDATVAATVIQWLGTNCGQCFVETTQRKIADTRK